MKKFTTEIIHDEAHQDAFGSPLVPLYKTTTFRFANTRTLVDVVEGRAEGALYSRYGHNPTVKALERSLARLEGAEAALAFGAGMAAISATLLALGRRGVVCVGDLYGGTQSFLTDQFRSLGFEVDFIRRDQLSQLEALLQVQGKLVYCESPANPTLSVLDLAQLADRVHACGGLLVVDNTFATPVNQQPLSLGADLVLHSATKYLGGHSDLTAGAVMGRVAQIAEVAEWRKNLGQVIAPEIASMLSRSLQTLFLRVRQHNDNALAIAEAMSRQKGVKRVLYPGLPDFPDHNIAKRQMSGFGGMVTLELEDGPTAAAVADNLRLFILAASLGGTESLVTQPCTTSHHDMAREERERRGITDGMLRLSVGLEDADDLIDDLSRAIAAAGVA